MPCAISCRSAREEEEKDTTTMVVAFVGCCHPKGDPNGSVGFSFTKREIPEHCKNTKGVPVYLTHKHHLGPVGRIAKAWQENGRMLVAGVIYDRTAAGKIASRGLLSGTLKGLSLGVIHGVMKNNSGKCTSILWREIVDVSVCVEGDLPGTLIMTVAAKEAVEKAIEDAKTSQPLLSSPYPTFYGSALTENTEESSGGGGGIAQAQAHISNRGNPFTATMSAESIPRPVPAAAATTTIGGKRLREMPPPKIPEGLRAAAMRPTSAQQALIDPAVQATNAALRQQQQQQQPTQVAGQPPAKKPRTEGLPAAAAAQQQQQPQPTEGGGGAAEEPEDQEPVALGKQEYVELLKAKAEKEEQEKQMKSLQKQLKDMEEKNKEWHSAASQVFGTDTDATSLRTQFNRENEDRALTAQSKVKEALKTAKEVKKLLVNAGKTPSPGLQDGLKRLEHYHKNPRQLLHKKCRDDVLNLVGWLGDYNQARIITVASNNKTEAQLEAELQTTQARYKELCDKSELKQIADTGQYPHPTPPVPSQQQQQQPRMMMQQPQPQQQQQQQQPQQQQGRAGYAQGWQQSQGVPQDCWANALSYRQTHEVMTTASTAASPPAGDGAGRFSGFYSNSSSSSVPMTKIDPGPPMKRPPSSVGLHGGAPILPFQTFYGAPVSEETVKYQNQLSRNLRFGSGLGRFANPRFVGKDYGTGSDLPAKWRSDDQHTFGRGRAYS